MCTRILKTQLELKQNVVENTLIKRENLWINPHIRLIKIKFHFSGVNFDDRFPTFGGLLHYGIPTPTIFAWLEFAKLFVNITVMS